MEVLLEHPRTKDHLGVTEGEVVHVLLLNHPKLPETKYLVEKDDGTGTQLRGALSGPLQLMPTFTIIGMLKRVYCLLCGLYKYARAPLQLMPTFDPNFTIIGMLKRVYCTTVPELQCVCADFLYKL